MPLFSWVQCRQDVDLDRPTPDGATADSEPFIFKNEEDEDDEHLRRTPCVAAARGVSLP